MKKIKLEELCRQTDGGEPVRMVNGLPAILRSGIEVESFIHGATDGRLSSRPSFFAGRGVNRGDLGPKHLKMIYDGVVKHFGDKPGLQFVRLIAELQDLSATAFLTTFNRFWHRGLVYSEHGLQAPGDKYNLDDLHGEELEAGALFTVLSVMGDHRAGLQHDYESESIRNEFLRMVGVETEPENALHESSLQPQVRSTHMAYQFYAVRWGDHARLSTKVPNAGAACRDTYGMVSENMEVRALGANKATALRIIREGLIVLSGYEPVPVEYLDKLNTLARQRRLAGSNGDQAKTENPLVNTARKRKIAKERIAEQFGALLEQVNELIVDCGEDIGIAVVTRKSVGFDVLWLSHTQSVKLNGRIE